MKMKTPEAVIFDMDGLMIDSERVTYESYVKVMEEEGLDFEKEFYKKVLGKTKQGIFEIFKERYGQDLPMDNIYQRVHQYISQEYKDNGVPVKPGLVSMLEKLNEKDIPCVIATSSNRHRVEDILKMSGLGKYYRDMVCGDDIVNGKPDPEIFLKAAKKAGHKPEECLVLEDSEAGIQAAHNAGIPVICVVDMKEPEKEFAAMTDGVVDSLDEAAVRIGLE